MRVVHGYFRRRWFYIDRDRVSSSSDCRDVCKWHSYPGSFYREIGRHEHERRVGNVSLSLCDSRENVFPLCSIDAVHT